MTLSINLFSVLNVRLQSIAKSLRYYILVSTTKAGSGHVTSSFSAVELMAYLFFKKFRFDWRYPQYPNNDRLIFSKGHASPLFYGLWALAGAIPKKELLNLRKFNSYLEGHPTPAFPYTEAGTGSLGQGLSVGLGLALNGKYLDKSAYQTYVLLGDGELAEGQIWEAMQLASFYKLDNLWAIADVNRLGQSDVTILGHDLNTYRKRADAFGWATAVADGHNFEEIEAAFKKLKKIKNKPKIILAKTFKGRGISFLEDKENWHGKSLSEKELAAALSELGKVDTSQLFYLKKPKKFLIKKEKIKKESTSTPNYQSGKEMATRLAYGQSLTALGVKNSLVVALDGDTKNSTYAEIFKKKFPKRFFDMFIAEQNMVSVAVGLAKRGKIPFVSTFAAFFTRAFDQIRMANYSNANIKLVGSHAGVSIGQDGVSQMGLEDLAMMRSILGSVVLYPSDAVSTEKLVTAMAEHKGIAYLRATRAATPVIYQQKEKFIIGGSKVLRRSSKDKITLVAAGITLHEALKAYEELKKKNILARVIDLYSVKPVDQKTLIEAARETEKIYTVEDHYAEGGIGSAVLEALSDSGHSSKVEILAVRKLPKSGTMKELLDYEGLSAEEIIRKIIINKIV